MEPYRSRLKGSHHPSVQVRKDPARSVEPEGSLYPERIEESSSAPLPLDLPFPGEPNETQGWKRLLKEDIHSCRSKGRIVRGGLAHAPAHLLLPSCPGRNPLDHRSEAGRSQGLLHDLGFMLVYHRAISMRRSGFWTRRRKRRNLNPNRHQTRHQGRIRGKEKSRKCLISLVRPAGVEPATFRFVVCCSIRAELRAQKGVRNLT